MESTASTQTKPRACFGLLTRRERWGLSWRGWIIAPILAFAFCVLIVVRLHPFLAVSNPVNVEGDGNYLVVEGWIEAYAVEEAVQEFKAHRYQKIFTTGGPIAGYTDADDDTYAYSAASRIKKL